MAVYKITPTKANLIKTKNSLEFAKKGYELLDKKRTVLIREMMGMIDKAKTIQAEIQSEFEASYNSIQFTNITLGSEVVESLAKSAPREEEFDIYFKSVMGVEVPKVRAEDIKPTTEYDFYRSNPAFDKAVFQAYRIRQLIYELAEVENAVFQLAQEIKKTQKRTNALNKISIPRYSETIKYIDEVLAEKEREDFFRLKKVKNRKKKVEAQKELETEKDIKENMEA